MIIEVLYPELCCLYGDQANIKYLQKCIPDATVHFTHNRSVPKFVTEPVDLIYLGTMTESKQEMALDRLLPYKDLLWERIEAGQFVLATGNAIELFGSHIEDNGKSIPALGYFPTYAKRDLGNRHNSMLIGQFEDLTLVGNKSQFSFSYGKCEHPFIKVTGGFGMNPLDATEGIHYKNFFGTYLLGPFLVLNPPFTKYLLRSMGCADTLAFEEEVMAAYNHRVGELSQDGVEYLMDECH